MSIDSPSQTFGSRLHRFWPMLIIIALALNLRPIVTSHGPLLEQIRADTGLSLQSMSLLTVLPMLCMGLFPLLLPRLGRRLSENSWIVGGLLAIAAGCAWRLFLQDGPSLILTALLAGMGVAVVQSLAPGVVKRWYTQHVPLGMGLYSAALMGGGGLAAVFSPLVARSTEQWQTGLGIWLLPALLAVLFWVGRPRESAYAGGAGVRLNCLTNRRAWLLAVYFGLANGGYASMVAWLPLYAQTLGWSTADSGGLVGLMTLLQVCAALCVPLLCRGRSDRRPWLLLAVVLQLIGFSGLVFWPDAGLSLWVALIGYGLGSCFALTLTLALDHLRVPAMAGVLAAFVQGVGFVITALIPYLAGMLRELAGSFAASWGLILVTLVLMFIATWRFAPSGYAPAMAGIEGPALPR
ncbi:CP family cyanate transporter-like MFS transporter [Marinobacterium halophilum]|uniref:CP family cyanate transporter-like MFS transporter n=1 Tax=Marinobacterium halophilum TaxID=267374 RepID=A0A2P8EYV8_9GAMM|nr:CynX/NimT family MFS transporter [Marinobacterium halophilum]PSL14651.1 CP family cyanate transporter-like MFS transporter [Marinobacterium halophilum]